MIHWSFSRQPNRSCSVYGHGPPFFPPRTFPSLKSPIATASSRPSCTHFSPGIRHSWWSNPLFLARVTSSLGFSALVLQVLVRQTIHLPAMSSSLPLFFLTRPAGEEVVYPPPSGYFRCLVFSEIVSGRPLLPDVMKCPRREKFLSSPARFSVDLSQSVYMCLPTFLDIP